MTRGLKMASAALIVLWRRAASGTSTCALKAILRLQVVTAASHTMSALAKLAPAAATRLASLVQRYTDPLVQMEPGLGEDATCRWV